MTPKEKQEEHLIKMMKDDEDAGMYNTLTKQTAVEWLVEQILPDQIHNPYIEQAKELERMQMIDAYNFGSLEEHYYQRNNCEVEFQTAEQYYNRTFKK